MKGREGGSRTGRGRLEQALSEAARGRFAEAIDAAAPLLESNRLGVDERLDLIRLLIEWNGLTGSFMECRRLAGRAVELGTSAFGARDPRVLIARSSELYWMCEVGYDALAEHRFAPLIDDVKQVLGTEHDLWWAVRTNSAMPAKAQGRFNDAADIYRGIIVDIAECLPDNDLRVLTVRDNYAEALFLDGQYDEAIVVYSSILDAIAEEMGAKDRRALRVRYEIARSRFASGDHGRALQEWAGLVADMERALGTHDDLTVSCRSLLIAAAVEADRNEVAAEQCRRLVEDPPASFEPRECEAFEEILRDCERRIAAEESPAE